MLQDAPRKEMRGDPKTLLNRRALLALGGLPAWQQTWPLLPIVFAMCIYGQIRHSAMMVTIFVAMALPRNTGLSKGGQMMKNLKNLGHFGYLGSPDGETLEGFSKRAKWHLQRRRLYVKWAADRVDKELHCAWRSVLPLSPRQAIASAVGGESRSLLCYHAAASSGFLLPPEVVSCSYLPEPGLRSHCVRLLREQWESEARHLASIPEEGGGSTWGWLRSNADLSTSSLEVQAASAEVY
mmetsp:Transcript_64676/g.79145  ORF Transcript_64676/g.79145 Transcript_64676/m.79145 type:complete len:239 (+) Transcript_64676:16-732(+)